MNTLNTRVYVDADNNINYPLWHPFASINKNYNTSLNVVRGEGTYIYDADGKKYLDASSGLWNISLGYGNPKIIEGIKQQLDLLPFCSLFEHTNPTAIKAANKILEILPNFMKRIFFTCSGSESIELAIKIMRKYWDLIGKPSKKTVVSLKDSYHGTYYGSMCVSGIDQDYIKGFGPLLSDIALISGGICNKCSIKANNDEKCNLECISEIEEFFKKNEDHIAGMVIEPILASKGVLLLGSDFINNLQRLCLRYDILLAIDEVAVGFYRTGTGFYCENFNIKPDIICMGKGINSGYLPMGAVALNDKICDLFGTTNEVLIHGSTQTGNLLSCAASIATIDQYKELEISQNVEILGSYLKSQLKEILSFHKNVGEIRGKGFLIEIELLKDKYGTESLSSEKIYIIQQLLMRNGLIVYRSDLGLTLLPMLIIGQSEADKIIEVIEMIFKRTFF